MNIPTGTVTFLFTDIEDSAKLSQEFSDSYQSVLQKHDSILKETIEFHKGFIFKKNGEAFCCSFEKCSEAVTAAVEVQKKIRKDFKDEIPLKVRMGIHTGEAEYFDEDYAGYITLSSASRVMSIAHGGQILITQDVYDDLKAEGVAGISFRNFGKRKLKDINHPLNIYQAVSDELPSDFHPIKSIDARSNNLPPELTKFIGREKEISEIKAILSNVHLLTIAGFGGTGKTRLAIHIAYSLVDEYQNGVWIVELAKLSEPSYVLGEISSVLKVTIDEKRKALDVLIDFLRDKELLLILDNCEHLINECAMIAEILLRRSPKLRIIVTSRESLHIFGETLYQLSSLSMPDLSKKETPEVLTQYESVRLFIDRARNVRHDFNINNSNAPAVAQLCFHLDGIPLAIELAAARVRVLSVEKILERISDRFGLLTGGTRTLLPRQQTLRAMIDWSYDLLSEKEKILCRRFSLFNGGCTLEAAEKILSDDILDEIEIMDLLSNLTDKSFIKAFEADNSVRFTMLESIRKYGEEKLIESGKKSELQERYFNYYYKFSEGSETKLTGSEQREWINKIDYENENLRSSLRWALINRPELALQMSVVLGKFWELRSHFSEGLEFLRKCLENTASVDLIWKAKAIYWTGFFLIHQAKYEESKKNLNESLEIFREIKFREGEAVTLISLATIGVFESDYDNLFLYSNESLVISREINNKPYIARNLQNMAIGYMQLGKYDEARIKFEESLSLYRELKDTLQLAKIISNIGALDYLLTNYEKASAAFEESLLLRIELGDRQGISIALNNLGSVAYMLKDFDESVRLLEESLEIIRELGDRRIYITAVNTLGNIAYDTGDSQKAKKLFTETVTISHEIGDKYSTAKGLEGFTNILIKQEKFMEGCIMAAKYVSLLESSNKNIIEGELTRIEDTKNLLKENLNEGEFEKFWTEGENMSVEEAMEFASQNMKE